MRTVLLLLLILISSVSVSASNFTLQSLNPSSRDTVIVGPGDTVWVIGNWRAGTGDTTCMVMFVAEGGLLKFTGSARANFGALWLGDRSTAPFNSTGGGRLAMGPNDTLGLWNTGILGSDDFRFRGANCQIDIDGGSSQTKAVIMGMSASDRPHIYGRESDGVFNVRYAKFYRLGSGTATPGLTLGTSGNLRSSSVQRIENSVFDSATVCFYGDHASVLNNCSLYVTSDWSYSGLYLYGVGDSVVNCLVQHDNRYFPYPHTGYMLVRVYADGSVLSGCTFKNVNGNGEGGRAEYGVRLYGNHIHLVRDTVDGFVWGINSDGSHSITIDSSVIIYCTHEGVLRLENTSDSAWIFRGNVFYGSGHERNSGYADVLLNFGPSDPDYLDYQFLYNTFCSRDVGDDPLSFRNHSWGSVSASGFTIVGNIFIGYNRDIRIANYGGATTQITCDEFKYNAFDNLAIESGCSFAIAGSAYNWLDSNLANQSQYGFVDSASFDLRLAPGSPMIGAGESIYGAQVFGGSGPYNIGYWQDGVGPNQAPELGSLISDTTITEGQTLVLNVSATDPNGTVPSLAATSIPNNASFTDHGNGNGTFTFTPAYDQAGPYTVTFIANDGSLADSQAVLVTVTDSDNAPPALAAVNDTTVAEAQTLALNITATDPDGTIPSVAAPDPPANATFIDHGNGAGTFTFNPVAGQAGIYDIMFVADDGSLTDTIEVRITVYDSTAPGPIIDLEAVGSTTTVPEGAIIADHNAVGGFELIGTSFFDLVRSEADIFYMHTSHGRQILDGLDKLTLENVLYSRPTVTEYASDAGANWVPYAQSHLNAHPECNMFIISWCGQLSSDLATRVPAYLERMTQLEIEYPSVIFVYMTGHIDGTGPDGPLKVNNDQIREYCIANDKVLFDFADIESYDPDGNHYPWDYDGCAWCVDWCATHSCSDDCDCAHSHCFNCYLKGKAFWWMAARLWGWNTTT